MTKMKFEYEKKDGEKTSRDVILITERKAYIDTIDTGHLDEKEINDIVNIQKEYEEKMAPYMKKAFRRFSIEGIKNLEVEKIKNG